MKRFALLVLSSVALLVCMGMGELSGQPAGTVPETDVPINAIVIDRDGVETSLSQFSMDGKTYLDAQHGIGQLTIPFQEVASINFGKPDGDQMPVKVTLKAEQTLDLTVRKRAVFYGSTGYGAYVIKARDLERIEFP